MADPTAVETVQYSIQWWDTVWNIARNVVFAVAGLGAATLGIWLTWRRTNALELQTKQDAKRLIAESKSQEEFLITQTFTRSIDQLGGEKLEVRLGAIYALERIARTSRKDHWTIIEILTAFVRERAPAPEPEIVDETVMPIEPRKIFVDTREDIQVALTVLGRRTVEHEEGVQRVNLRATNLSRYDLSHAKLAGADLRECYFRYADLNGANLEAADLEQADLQNANLDEADLTKANLKGADLYRANLRGTKFDCANLVWADLTSAKGLTQIQLDQAIGNSTTRLPKGLVVGSQPE